MKSSRIQNMIKSSIWSLSTRVVAITLLAAGFLVAVGAANIRPAPREVEAERFVLQDDKGNTRAVLETNQDGTPRLDLLDLQGVARTTIGSVSGFYSVTLTDSKGNPRLMLSMDDLKEGLPSIDMMTNDGKSKINIGMRQDQTPFIQAWAGPGQTDGIGISVLPDGSTGVEISGQDSSTRVRIEVKGGEPKIEFYKNNQMINRIPN